MDVLEVLLVTWPHALNLGENGVALVISAVLSVCGGLAVYGAIEAAGDTFCKAGLHGRDLCKRANQQLLPESMGMISGTVFLMVMFVFTSVRFSQHLVSVQQPFPHLLFGQLLTALLCICCMLLLGFADDVLNLKWRYKLVLPTLASVPLLMTHYINFGSTTIAVPLQLRWLLRNSINIGPLYYIYMSLLAVFCTNAINIYAGINGLECGQSVVVAASVAAFNAVELSTSLNPAHHLSLCLLMPFIATSFALFLHNRYPARVFVGDTFTYFAGMIFAVVGILGHFSKTVLLFFLPQLANFAYSLPQLFRLLPCPRHRLPQYNSSLDKLEFSRTTVRLRSLHPAVYKCMMMLSSLRLLSVTECSRDEKFEGEATVTFNNLTLINLVLVWCGPMHEASLTYFLLTLQVFASCLAFVIRYPLANLFYDRSNVL